MIKSFGTVLKNCALKACFIKQIQSIQNCSSKDVKENEFLGEIGAKYKIFDDNNADVILDIYEEKLKYKNLLEEELNEEEDPFKGINLESMITVLWKYTNY